MSVRFTQRALSDLNTVANYIEQNNPAAAAAVIARIENTVHYLQRFPFMGHASYLPKTRELTVPRLPFKIVYMVDGETITVLTVIHTSRDRNTYLDTVE